MAKDGTRQGMILSTVVHVVFFGMLIVFILLENLRSEPEPIVFTLVSETPGEQVEDSPQPSPALPEVATPQIEQVKEVEFTKIPEPQPPAPTPTPPKPTPPKPKPEVKKPEPTPEPKKPDPKPEPPKPQTISAEDFFKQHKRQEQTVTQVKPKTVVAPKINTKIFDSIESAIVTSPSSRPMSQSEQDALSAYVARLRSQINLAWQKPEQASSSNEWVQVVVTVSPSGKITNYRITDKSASSTMVRSVERAVTYARSAGPTPDGRSHDVQFTLRLREE